MKSRQTTPAATSLPKRVWADTLLGDEPSTAFPTQGQYSICPNATTSYSSYKNSKKHAKTTAAVKNFYVELQQLKEN